MSALITVSIVEENGPSDNREWLQRKLWVEHSTGVQKLISDINAAIDKAAEEDSSPGR